MDKKQKLKIELARDRADTWARDYARITAQREKARKAAAQAISAFRNATISVTVDDSTYRVLPLTVASLPLLTDLASYIQLPPYTEADKELLHQLDKEIPETIRDVVPIIEPKLVSRQSVEDAEDAAEFLLDYVSWALAEGVENTLQRVTPAEPEGVTLANSLSPALGLGGVLATFGKPELLPAASLSAPLATFTAAEKFPELAHALIGQPEYVVVCSPAGHSAADLVAAISQ